MPGFIFRLVVCNALCLAVGVPVLWLVAVPLMESRDWGYLGVLVLIVVTLIAPPFIWFRTYRWLEDAERRRLSQGNRRRRKG